MTTKGTLENRFKTRFKDAVLKDTELNKDNQKLFIEYFDYLKKKLRRTNNKGSLDESNYKHMYNMLTRLLTVNRWFKNKSWYELTERDIEKVYDKLLDGSIKTNSGKPYGVDGLKESYFNKVLKSKPFELAGKADICRKLIYHVKPKRDVRFIREDEYRKILTKVNKIEHQILFWLSWDIGENITSLLELTKRDFTRQINQLSRDPEYRINLKQEILKRSRRARGIITNHPETVMLLDQVLSNLNQDDKLFSFGYSTAKKIMQRAVDKSDSKCIPNGEKVTWKDLRSSMACDLLGKGWTTDEVNARLGHKPSSDEIDKYVNFLAIDTRTPKRKIEQFKMGELQRELEEIKEQRKLEAMRRESLERDMKQMQEHILRMNQKSLRKTN